MEIPVVLCEQLFVYVRYGHGMGMAWTVFLPRLWLGEEMVVCV